MQETDFDTDADASKIAIIGMAGRFPGAASLETFWHNLTEGVEAISVFTDEELRANGVSEEKLGHPDYVKAGAVLEDIDLFDASFFGYTPREAALMDPQHRLFLECAWEALEHAGYNPDAYRGRIGIYAGSSVNTYLVYNICSSAELIDPEQIHATFLANDKDHLATRVAYKCNLRGPAVTIQTTCSTSLVATHMACQSLLNGEADIMLVGGSTIRVPHRTGYLYQPSGVLSPDGHCRTFDKAAQGTVIGNGVGVVVLKRLSDALSEHDTVHAVILGSAINNDGSLKAGYTAPSEEGQAAVVAEALAVSGIDPNTVTYIETHGTGTIVGDPIEIAALTQVYSTKTRVPGSCKIGSLKTNIGHLDAAAGAAGLIKTVFSLKHQIIPPTLHFQQANPEINFAATPFAVNTQCIPWKTGNFPRRAGITSLGIGGTNVHILLEEAPIAEQPTSSDVAHLLLLSAKSEGALQRMKGRLAEHLRNHPEQKIEDVAYTLQVGRKSFPHRCYLVSQNRSEAISALESQYKEPKSSVCKSVTPTIAFLFPGQGTQYVNMARDLSKSFPDFQTQLHTCLDLLKKMVGLDLYGVLYPKADQFEEATQKLNQTAISQPALFSIEYALAQLWMSWGIRPQAMLGHSVGEYVAACLAGVFSLEDALALVADRGRLMQQMPVGAMLAVALSEQDIQPLLEQGLSLAAVNSPLSCVVSGPIESIRDVNDQLTQRGKTCRLLHTSHAFHSQMMEPVRIPFLQRVQRVSLKPPRIPYISNVTGTWITDAQATNPAYWANHLCSPVQFSHGIETLERQHIDVLLESGPGHTLSTLARHHTSIKNDRVVISSIRQPQSAITDEAFLLHALGKLWLSGVDVNWQKLHSPKQYTRVPLPTYAFDRQRYWVERRVRSIDTPAMPVTSVGSVYSAVQDPPNVVGPRNFYEVELAHLWQQALGFTSITIHDDFFELGGDSFVAVSLVNRMKQRFQVPIALEDLIRASTIAKQASLLQGLVKQGLSASEGNKSPLVALKATGTRPPLFLIHPSGGTVLCYLELARCLEPEQPLYGLQTTDGNTGPNYAIVEEVAAFYLEHVRTVQPHGPYRLGGMSYGGTVAFEMARQLHRQGETTDLLVLFDSHPPVSFHGLAPNETEFLAAFPYILRMYLGQDQPLFTYEELCQHDPRQQEAFVFDYINMHKLFALNLDLAELRDFFSMWQINNRSLRQYNPPDGSGHAPIALFLASEAQPSELLDLLKIKLTDQLSVAGWEKLSSSSLQVYTVPGSHYTMLNRPHVQALAKQLERYLKDYEPTKVNSY